MGIELDAPCRKAVPMALSPKTQLGKWSFYLWLLIVAMIVVGNFTSRLFITFSLVPLIASFVIGIVAVARLKERSFAVFASVLTVLLILIFELVGE